MLKTIENFKNIIKIINQPGAAVIATLVAISNVNGAPVKGAVVLALNADPSENGEAGVAAIVVVEPKEMFKGTFEAVLLPNENPKQLYTFIY